ncbi:chemotaxis protein chel [Alloyangia pacifica]|uniref:chemotaxis protein chel n=1 Tax=Alloyangia pacifica TaxID=311180 RepID=UPI001CFDEB88|nr:chemotaxis protein chel [Alloyangia pacifica]
MTDPLKGQALAPQHALLNRLYVSQMLKFSGLFASRASYGGGAGEEQFASFLREEYAARLADRVDVLPARLAQRASSR